MNKHTVKRCQSRNNTGRNNNNSITFRGHVFCSPGDVDVLAGVDGRCKNYKVNSDMEQEVLCPVSCG